MKLPLYQIDAFTNRMFSGNPAAVVIIDSWLPDEDPKAIAAENNLAETAFVIPHGEAMPLRWFTPTVEVDLCGHATLAAAHVLFRYTFPSATRLTFNTRSGNLTVTREDDFLSMDFPSRPGKPLQITDAVISALGIRPQELYHARDLLAIFESESEIRAFCPNFERLARLDTFAVIISAPGDTVDYVYRFFAPRQGIPEDPGDRVCKLHARPLLGRPPGSLGTHRETAFSQGRRCSMRTAWGPRQDRRASRRVFTRRNNRWRVEVCRLTPQCSGRPASSVPCACSRRPPLI